MAVESAVLKINYFKISLLKKNKQDLCPSDPVYLNVNFCLFLDTLFLGIK
jgi:hypothetical protein